MKKWLVFVAILVLLVAHQDYWQWDRADLVLGFVPYNMAYHVVLSMVAAVVWFLICVFCWPRSADEVDFGDESEQAAEDRP